MTLLFYTTMFSTVNLCKEWNDTTTAFLTLQQSFCLRRIEQMWRENTGTHRSRSTGTVPAGLGWSSLSGTRSDQSLTVWAEFPQICRVWTLSFLVSQIGFVSPQRSHSLLLWTDDEFVTNEAAPSRGRRLQAVIDSKRSPWQLKFVCLFVLPQSVSFCYVYVTTVVS